MKRMHYMDPLKCPSWRKYFFVVFAFVMQGILPATPLHAKGREAVSYDTSLLPEAARLPLQIIPATHEDAAAPMVLLLTGDGGWKGFDVQLAGQFAAKGMPVAALNSLKYFWSKKTPEQATETVAAILNAYLKTWKKQSFILAGFSFGADVLPFVANRLEPALMQHCKGIVLFSPGASTDFEIHISQMLSGHKQWKYNVVQEMQSLHFRPALCVFGETEHEYPVNTLQPAGINMVVLPGGHHYEDNKADIAALVMQHL